MSRTVYHIMPTPRKAGGQKTCFSRFGPKHLPLPGQDDECETDNEKNEHREVEKTRLPWRALELAPDEDAPECRHERRALAESVGYSRARLARRDEVDAVTAAPGPILKVPLPSRPMKASFSSLTVAFDTAKVPVPPCSQRGVVEIFAL